MGAKTGRKLATAAAVAALLVAAAPAVPASEQPMRFVGEWEYEVPGDLHPVPDIPPGSLVLNPLARTGFQFFEIRGGSTFLRIFDLDTFETRHELTLPRIIPSRGTARVTQYVHAIDEENNVLYVPYYETIQAPGTNWFGGLLGISGDTGETLYNFRRSAANDPTAALRISEDPDGPEDLSACTSNSCLPQTFGVQPQLIALDFSSSFVSGGRSKLLMFWHEPMGPALEGNVFVTWATQWDATTGVQDFSYRIQSCTVRVPANPSSAYPLSIFQARLGGGIYLGCNAQGNTGQVVRIRLDANGQPSGEDTYPGPISVADVLADRETDRLIFRVATSTSGDVFWVFNGSSSNYSGIIAGTLSSVPTRLAVNPVTGRLYMMTPDNSKGNEEQAAGLYFSDIRRTPAPQMTGYTDMYVESFLPPFIDTHHPSGHPRLLIQPAETSTYVIIEDGIAPGADEPLRNLDRFTVDVEEEEGVTDANFTGTGHAYGLRTLLAGGLQGATPIGVDVSGATARYSVAQLNSACQTPDREFRFGSIPFANIANALTSAESAAVSTEAGTIADIREPSGRCQPRPLPGTADENKNIPPPLSDDDDSDGQSNLDETLGSEWPFQAAQCSGEGEDAQIASIKPMDRDPVPQGNVFPDDAEIPATDTPADQVIRRPRDTAIPLDVNRAAVACAQSEQFVTADATAGAAIIDGLPGIGTIEIGSVGGFTDLRRDPERGLVAETVSYVRDIRIGDLVSIDVAYSKAIAFAGGRPGTAGTVLDRRVCGISIPEEFSGRYDVIPLDTPVGPLPPNPDPIPVGDPLYEVTKDVENPQDGSDGVSYPIGNVDPLNDDTEDQTVPSAVQACAELPVSQANATPLGRTPVMEAINRALGARGRMYVPEPDPELRQGSPGGYLASIQKDRLQQIGSRAVSNDGTTQIPAFELQLFNDDPQFGRGRQLFQFAGVDASVTYGIYLLNPEYPPIDDPNDDLPPGDITDDLIDFTGGPSLPPIGGSTPPPTTTPGPTGVFAPVTYLYRGVSVLARSWQDAALAAGVLMMLIGPLVLMARRRALRTLT